jgi:hypothetical protein
MRSAYFVFLTENRRPQKSCTYSKTMSITLNVTNVAPVSDIRAAAMLVMLMVSKTYDDDLQWHDIHTDFH